MDFGVYVYGVVCSTMSMQWYTDLNAAGNY
jgi:hypothetical protein